MGAQLLGTGLFGLNSAPRTSFGADVPLPWWYYWRNSRTTRTKKRGSVMLQKSHADAAYCNVCADENRRMAEQQNSPVLRQTYLDLEARWIKLALSYENADRLNQYIAHLACALDQPPKNWACPPSEAGGAFGSPALDGRGRDNGGPGDADRHRRSHPGEFPAY